MEFTAHFTTADLEYIEANFVCLDSASDGAPAASYVLEDGRKFYPREYAQLETDEQRFKSRLAAACAREDVSDLDPDEAWAAYMTGIFGVCLTSATPENIVRKMALLQRIETLTSSSDDGNAEWLAALKAAVDALDTLERPFSPNYDRARFGRPTTRESHITAIRELFPAIARPSMPQGDTMRRLGESA